MFLPLFFFHISFLLLYSYCAFFLVSLVWVKNLSFYFRSDWSFDLKVHNTYRPCSFKQWFSRCVLLASGVPLDPVQEAHEVKTVFIGLLRHYLLCWHLQWLYKSKVGTAGFWAWIKAVGPHCTRGHSIILHCHLQLKKILLYLRTSMIK